MTPASSSASCSILRLAEAVIARVSPETLLADIADIDDVRRFGRAVEARIVGDVMLGAGRDRRRRRPSTRRSA